MSVKEPEPKDKLYRAKYFLAKLLDDTLYWSCTDRQHALEEEFKEILGEYCPDWLDPNRVTEE